jgi:2-hydroxycyclohexanecarboxyl-CoA dehydrogenase
MCEPRLAGHTALVTGAASGIGAATARRLAAEGATVVVADRDREGATVVAKEIDGIAVELDVTIDDSIRAAIAEAEAATAPVDVLVNNAGGGRFAMFTDTDPATWERELAVNLIGTMACTHAVLAGMCSRRRGAIVNVASAAGISGTVAGASYAAAKAGAIGFTKAIAREAAPYGVRCNAVAPGPVNTPLLQSAAEEHGAMGAALRSGMIEATVMKRAAHPDEIAAAIAFLASGDASFVTGHTLAVCGGASMT